MRTNEEIDDFDSNAGRLLGIIELAELIANQRKTGPYLKTTTSALDRVLLTI